MWHRGKLAVVLSSAAALSACASTSHTTATVSGTSATGTSSAQAAAATTALAARARQPYEFQGFNAPAPVVENDVVSWVTVDVFDPAQVRG